jgi:hypothetical protein
MLSISLNDMNSSWKIPRMCKSTVADNSTTRQICPLLSSYLCVPCKRLHKNRFLLQTASRTAAPVTCYIFHKQASNCPANTLRFLHLQAEGLTGDLLMCYILNTNVTPYFFAFRFIQHTLLGTWLIFPAVGRHAGEHACARPEGVK